MSDFEICINALEERGVQDNPDATPNDGRVLPTASSEPAANRDLPTYNIPDGDESTPPTNATINSCVMWACSHAQQCLPPPDQALHWIPQCTPPCAPIVHNPYNDTHLSSRLRTPNSRQSNKNLHQSTLPEAFQPCRNSERVNMVHNDQDNGRIDQQDGTLTSPGRVNSNHNDSTSPSNCTLDVVGGPIICP
jgi:hypothetical protein